MKLAPILSTRQEKTAEKPLCHNVTYVSNQTKHINTQQKLTNKNTHRGKEGHCV